MTTIINITLFLFLFLPPNNILVGAQIVYSGIEGEELTVQCFFDIAGTSKIFCKEPCIVANSLFWLPNREIVAPPLSYHFTGGQTNREVSVTFRRLTKADGGSYHCVLIGLYIRLTKEVTVRVIGRTERRQNKPLTTTTTTTTQAGSVTEFTTADSTYDTENVWLYVGPTLAALVVLLFLLVLSVLVYCRKRSSAAKDPSEGAKYVATSQAHSIYQNVGLDKERVEIFSVDSHAKTHNSVVNSLPTENTAAEDSATPTYSHLLFPQPSSSVVHGGGHQVVYAVPHTREKPAVHYDDNNR